MDPNDIVKNYTKLICDGLITFNIVKLFTDSEKKNIANDVIVCLYKTSTMEDNIQEPDVVCRQNISDLYYNYQRTNVDKEMVGMCMTKATCPANLDYMIMTACDDIEYSIGVNIYIEDNIYTILSMIPQGKINRVLEGCLKQHLSRYNIFDNGTIESHDGYCRRIVQLLKENNFQYDFDTVFNITGLNVDIKEHLISKKSASGEEIIGLKNDIINQLNNLFKINIADTIVIEYDHDIDLSEFEGVKYFLIRDINNISDNKLYIVNYVEDGEYRKIDLEDIAEEQARMRIPLLFNRDKYKD